MKIRVAIAGAKGRMGSQVVRSVIASPIMEVVAGFDPAGIGDLLEPGLADEGVRVSSPAELEGVLKETKPHVFVDFTNADAAVTNVKVAARNGIKLVIGTTGFSDTQFEEMEAAIKDTVPAIISPNFSIGVNIFWRLVAEAARLLMPYHYHVEVIEMHHAHKKDAPSGTAKKAAELIARYMDEVRFVYGRQGMTGERGEEEIGIHAIRGGDIVGDHTVLFAGTGERLELIHRAHSREAFAQGVLKAIEWINTKEESGIYTMEEMMRELEGGYGRRGRAGGGAGAGAD